jgi:hypothetical protein
MPVAVLMSPKITAMVCDPLPTVTVSPVARARAEKTALLPPNFWIEE